MRLISWNVNGLRACLGKGFLDYFKESKADIFCIQETKMQKEQAEVDTPGYFQYWNSAEKKGYVAADAELSGEAGDSAFSMGGELVYKIKDGKLGAIYAQASADAAKEDVVSFDTQAEMGLVYSYGGQSNTLPEVK